MTFSASTITVCYSLPVHALPREARPVSVIHALPWFLGYSEVCCTCLSFFDSIEILEGISEKLCMKARLGRMRMGRPAILVLYWSVHSSPSFSPLLS